MTRVVAGVLSSLLSCSGALAGEPMDKLRIAQFNIWELSRAKLDERGDAGHGANAQLRNAAQILQRIRPDVLLVNEIDFDPEGGDNARLFLERYLGVGQAGLQPLDFEHVYSAPVNTGVPTGHDLDNDGQADGPADAYGFGRYPGQYGMALLSRFAFELDRVRSLRLLPWSRMPGNLMPDGSDGKPAWYGADEAALLRLSSKSHWDVPVRVGEAVIHLLCAHPTPPVFDGPEDHNGRRNFDEIRLLADYVTGGPSGDYIVDDQGRAGGLAADAHFVVMGDMNADPTPREVPYGRPAISQLLESPRILDPAPASVGAHEGEIVDSAEHPERRTSRYGRLDYVLPSRGLEVVDSGVFWPAREDPLRQLVEKPDRASDHHLVWVDVRLRR